MRGPIRRLSAAQLATAPDGSRVEVSGRILVTTGMTARLADAFGTCSVALAVPAPLKAFRSLILEGDVVQGALRDGRVVQRFEPTRHVTDASGEHLRLLYRGVGRNLAERARALCAIRAFFEARDFLEVETPAVVPSPGLDVHLEALVVEGARFEAPGTGYLMTSPEYQMKRLLVGGMPRIFQVARCHRRGELGRHHNPEFTMLEWYRAFSGVEEVMADTEALVREVGQVLGSSLCLDPPYARLSVAEAFGQFAGIAPDDCLALARRDPDAFYRVLVEVVEPAVATMGVPVFLVDYPTPFASLARQKPGDDRVAERFELYVGGVELCNGFGGAHGPHEQRARLLRDQHMRAEQGKPVYPIDERFLAALAEGMPPSSGNALGVDRLIAICLGTEDIADVQAFPADRL